MIRKMTNDDLEIIAQLEMELFSMPWSKKDFFNEINENPYSQYFVYEQDGKILGYIGEWIMFEQAQITTIGVTKDAQLKGIGSLLMEHSIKNAESNGCEVMSLEVRVSNEKAIHLYKKFGFITVNIRKGYYQDNHEDAYLMVKALEVEL